MSKETPIKININDTCKVKLTERGHEIFFKYKLKELLDLKNSGVACSKLNTQDFVPLKLDDDGKAKFMLHELMHIFGPNAVLGTDAMFEKMSIEIEREQS